MRSNDVIDKTDAFRFFKVMISLINEFFGVTWTDYQMIEVSKELYTNYYHWRIADAKNFVSRCRRLHYGKIYGTLTPAILMEWAGQYNDEWLSASEQISLAEHDRAKHQDDRLREVQIRDGMETARKMTQVYEQWKVSQEKR